MAEGPKYAFHPLERRGLLLGLDVGQLLTIAAGALAAIVAHAAIGGVAGVLLGMSVALGGLLAALWTREGSPLGARALTATVWLLRGSSRPVLDESPTAGRVLPAPGRIAGPPRSKQSTGPVGIRLTRDEGLPGERPLGVVRDGRAGTWAAVIPVRGCSYALLDPSEQAQRLESWRRVLGALARPGSPVVRVQWIQRSWSGAGGPDLYPGSAFPEASAGPSAHETPVDASVSQQRLIESVEAAMVHHHAWLILAVRPSSTHLGARGSSDRAVTELRRELRLVEGQLRNAGLDPLGHLDLPQLAALAAPPGVGRAGVGAPWPTASVDSWSAYRADGSWHATYWIAEWPRLDVGPDFLTPLLVGPEHKTVSVVMAPVPPDRAMREVRSARTADLADAELRARAGFIQSARRDRESEGVTRREGELADGHQEFRFSGYVTVSAEDPEGLAAACAATEHAAQSARLELRRLYGRQAEAYTWTLPLARGLR